MQWLSVMIYNFVEQNILRISFVRAGKRFSETYGSSDELSADKLSSLKKKTSFYKRQRENMAFKSLDKDKPDFSIFVR